MRTYLPKNTILRIKYDLYQIIGDPIGEGGGSIIYPAVRLFQKVNESSLDQLGSDYAHSSPNQSASSQLYYAIKECFPLSDSYTFVRDEHLQIVPWSEYEKDTSVIEERGHKEERKQEVKQEVKQEAKQEVKQAEQYLKLIQKMQLEESRTTAAIYKKGFRLTPIILAADSAEISTDYGRSFTKVNNTYTVMESLEEKGRSLESYQKEYTHFSLIQALRSVEQILLAVDEVHKAGYLHLDIQAGNVFLKGSLEDTSDFASLIDFGAARPRMEDGKTDVIADRMLFATKGYSAPEMILHNDGNLRLGPEADLYSVGYLLLYLITGRKENPSKLYHNMDGVYIPARRMTSLHCPKHLQGSLQEIFRRALAQEPEGRYHSAQEMIRDIRQLSEALQPYRSDLASVKYDAFICYRHNDLDSQIARTMQKQLEHFPVPRSVKVAADGSKSNKKKIERVFLDEGELSACGDMGSQIGEALKNSGYLIVLCSKGTKESPWVNLEIDTFLKYHDRSRVLAILTEEGEPYELFPEQLKASMKTDEVFAADIRSDNGKDAIRRLKKDAIYRIAAPILGTTYDSLKQRRKVYTVQRATVACLLFLALVSAFAVSYMHQNRKAILARQKQLIAESGVLIREAAALKEDGQIGDAVRSLLSALPSEDNPRPLVPKAQNNLIDYLDLYESIGKRTQQLELIVEAQNLPLTNSFVLDPWEEYLLLSDDRSIYVLDAFDLSTLFTYSLDEPIMDLMTGGEISKNVPLRKENMDAKRGWLFTHSNDQVICYDYKNNKLVWTKEMNSVDGAGGRIAFLRYDAAEGQVYVVADSQEGPLLAQMKAENGQVSSKCRISKDSGEHTYIEANELAFLKEDAFVFMTDQCIVGEEGISYRQYIYIYDNNLRQRARVSYKEEGLELDAILYGVNLMEEESVLLYMTEDPYLAEDGEVRGKGYIAAYDIEKQKVLYKHYLYEAAGAQYSCGNNLMAWDEHTALSVANNAFILINAVDGSIISKGVGDWDTSLSRRDYQELTDGWFQLGGRYLWNGRDYEPRFYDSFGSEYQFKQGTEDEIKADALEIHARSLFPEEENEDILTAIESYIMNDAQDIFYLYEGSTLMKYGYRAENSFYHPLDDRQNYLDEYIAVGEWKNQSIFLHYYSYDEEDEHENRIYYNELYYVDEEDEIHQIPLPAGNIADQYEIKGDRFLFRYEKEGSDDDHIEYLGSLNLVDEKLQTREVSDTNFYACADCTAWIQNGQIIIRFYGMGPSDDEEIVVDTGEKGLGGAGDDAWVYPNPSGDKMLVHVDDNDSYYLIGRKTSNEAKDSKAVKESKGTILKKIPPVKFGFEDITWSEDGAYFLFGQVVYDSSGREISRIGRKKEYNFRCISPDNRYIYYIFCNYLYQFDLPTGTLLNEKRVFALDEDGEMTDGDAHSLKSVEDVNYQYWKVYDDKIFLSVRFGSSWLISTDEDAFGVLTTIPEEAIYNEKLQKFYIIKYYPDEGEVPFGYYDAYSLEQIREIAVEQYGMP